MVEHIRMLRKESMHKYATSSKGLPDDDLILFEIGNIRMYTRSTDVADLVKFCKDTNYCYDIYCKINTDYAANMEVGIPVGFVTYDPGIYSPGMGTFIEASELKDATNAFKNVLETREPSLF